MRLVFLAILLSLSCPVYAAAVIKLQVVTDYFQFSKQTVSSGQMKLNDQGEVLLILNIKTGPQAALKKLSEQDSGKQILITYNKQLIGYAKLSKSFDKQVVLTGLSIAQARTFLASIHNAKG
jgi:hypothetical protein